MVPTYTLMEFQPAPAPSTAASLFACRAKLRAKATALRDDGVRRSYGELRARVAAAAGALRARGVGVGDRVAIIARNRAEYLETLLACGWLGAIAACQNWRLAPDEMAYCIDLVDPALVVGAPAFLAEHAVGRACLPFDDDWEAALDRVEPVPEPVALDPEAPSLILYTSGTTGRPKGAVISHRALVARNLVVRAELGLHPDDAFAAWSPMYHMGGAEYSLGTLMSGGTVHVVDGFDASRLAELVRDEVLGWLLFMPGMVGRFADLLDERAIRPRGVRVCGVMADLVPQADLVRITELLDAPYVNSFGATETGNPPASAGLLPVGVGPSSLSKVQSAFCEVRLVDEHDADVPDGTPGELCMRGPTLFSGYWNAPEVNAHEFRGGWFHMGDVFVRLPDGTLDFVDRRKYMIKSGGENIYPAEIERVLLAVDGVTEAAVVKRSDPTWGEVPVAFVARSTTSLTEADLIAACKARLASFKKPKGVVFIDHADFPRSASGKVQRHLLETR